MVTLSDCSRHGQCASSRLICDARDCRNEHLLPVHIYTPNCMLTHGPLASSAIIRAAFSIVLVGNQNTE